MKVSVTRTGGLAGIRRSRSVDVDAQPDSASWHAQVDALPWTAPRPGTSTRGADRFVYTITVDGADEPRTITLGEADLDEAWRALVDRVRAAS
jgi:hypothetical protein